MSFVDTMTKLLMTKTSGRYKDLAKVRNEVIGFARARLAEMTSRVPKENERMCIDCSNILPKALFPSGKICNQCKIDLFNEDPLQNFAEHVVTNSRARAAKAGIPFSVTEHDIVSLYRKQNGRCALSDIPLTFVYDPSGISKSDRMHNLSIDQIRAGHGYTHSNIQLVAYQVNVIKMDLAQHEFIRICSAVHRKWNPVEKICDKENVSR